MKDSNSLSDEEIKTASLLSLRNKKLSKIDIEHVKRNLCGKMSGDGLSIMCFICSDSVNIYDDIDVEMAIDWISHIRNHLKDLQIYL